MPSPTLAASDFELLFGALPTPCAVLDAEGQVVELNAALAALLPEAAALLGQPAEALRAAATAGGLVLPDAAAWAAGLSQARAGSPQRLMPRSGEEKGSGGPRRYWQAVLQPVLAPGTTALRYVLLQLLDVSEQLATAAGARQQEQLRRLTEDLPQLLWTANAEGLVNYANQAWYEYTGLTPVATYGQGWLSAVHPNDRDAALAGWQQAVASHDNAEIIYRLRQGSTGQYRWHLSRGVPQRDAEGSLQQWLGSVTDVHEQQVEARRQRRRQRQSQRLLTQLDQLPLYLVLMRGPRHEISYVSASARAFLTAEATGREAASLQPSPGADTLAAFDEVYRTGETRHLGQLPAQLRPETGGTTFMDVTVLPLRAPDGSVEGVLMTGIDVTDRLTFERRVADVTADSQRLLAAKEAQQRRILDQLPSYIATYEGPELRLSYLSPNHTELLGSPRAQVGQTLREAAPELAEQGLEALLRNVYETGQPYQAFGQELAFQVPATGEMRTRYLNFGYYPLYGDEGQPQGILAFANDVTEQVQAHRQAAARAAEARAADLRLRHMTESLPNSTFICDETGRIVYLSPQWYAFTGLASADDPAQHWAGPVHPDDAALVQEQFGTALATGQPWRYEFRLRRHDGEYRWFLSLGVPEPLEVAQAAGRPRQWFGSNLEVNDLKQAQQQLEQKDRQLSQMLSLMPVSVATLAGPEHRFTYYNDDYNALVGHRACLGKTVAHCLPEVVEQGFTALLDGVYATGHTYTGLETPIQMADANAPDPTALREFYLNFTYQALRDEAGAVNGVLIVAIDVTGQVLARREAEELQARVRRRDHRIRLMAESLPLISYISSADAGVTEYLSPQWYSYTGTDPATTDPTSEWARAIHPDDLAGLNESFDAALRARQPWTGELRLRRHDGQYRWHLTRAVPELNAETGAPLRWYGSTTDVHELRQTRHELEVKDRQLSQILSQSPALLATLEGPEHRFAFTNPGYDRLVSYRAQVGCRAADCLPEIVEQGFLGILDKVYQTGEPFVGEEVHLDILNPATEQLEEHFLDFTYQALRNAEGGITGILAFIVDVTERVHARRQTEALQADLRWRDDRLRALTRTVPVFIFSYAPGGQLTYFNPYFFEYTGIDPEGPLEAAWDAIHPDDAPPTAAAFEQALAAGSGWENTFRMRRADGEYVGSSRVDLQACKLEYSIVSPK